MKLAEFRFRAREFSGESNRVSCATGMPAAASSAPAIVMTFDPSLCPRRWRRLPKEIVAIGERRDFTF